MWRGLAIVLAASVVWTGCGARDVAKPPPDRDRRCPEGTEPVQAREIVGRPVPSGYQLVPGDTTALRRFATQFRDRIGEAWIGYDARVLVRKGQANGAAVVVLNTKDRTDGSALVDGIERGAKQRGRGTEPIEVAGREGRVVEALDGAYIAMAPARQCAVVMLVADRKPLVVDAASVIPDE